MKQANIGQYHGLSMGKFLMRNDFDWVSPFDRGGPSARWRTRVGLIAPLSHDNFIWKVSRGHLVSRRLSAIQVEHFAIAASSDSTPRVRISAIFSSKALKRLDLCILLCLDLT